MKKRSTRMICFLAVMMITVLLPVQEIQAGQALYIANKQGHNLEDRYQPAGSIITEINTGMILWEEDAEVAWAPASLTKLMTILLTYDAMEQGKFTLDTEAEVTEKYVDIACRYAMSNNNMQLGASYKVWELIELAIVPSSAAATYMLADMVEPDADKFVQMMNARAKELGMTQTTYYNCVGVRNELLWPYHPASIPLESDNVTSPRDYALLCSYFVKTYPDLLNHTASPHIVIKKGTPYEESFDSHHVSLKGEKYELKGTDGIKTGSSDTAGFNYSATTKRGDTRLVEIVMGVSTWEDQIAEEIRHIVGNAIMEEAFAKYEYKLVLSKGEHTIEGKKIVTEQDLWDCVEKNSELKFRLENGLVKVDMERKFLPGYEAAGVSYQMKAAVTRKKVTGVLMKILKLLGVLILLAVLGIAARIGYVYYRKQQRRKRRRKRKK